jgi:hypothetical protein
MFSNYYELFEGGDLNIGIPYFGHHFFYAVFSNVPCQLSPHFEVRYLISVWTPFGWLAIF